jgi:hypothetical protein
MEGGPGGRVSFDDGLSSNALIKSLELSQGKFQYPFNSNDWKLRASVKNEVNFISLTPVLDHLRASMTVNGEPLASGLSSPPIDLITGKNIIEILVTAQDDTTNLYTLIVTRHSENYTNAGLSELSLAGDDLSPVFDPDSENRDFTAVVMDAAAAVTVTAEAADEGATIRVVCGNTEVDPGSIPLETGSNRIKITVTAPDGETTETYYLNIVRQTTDAGNSRLALLTVHAVDLDQQFSGDMLDYTITVPGSLNPVAISTITESNNAGVTATCNGSPVADLSSITLSEGTNTIEVIVTSGDGSSVTTYTLTAILLAAGTNANLSGLTITMGENNSTRPLYPGNFDRNSPNYHDPDLTGFDPDLTEYTAVVYAFDTLTINATADDPYISGIEIRSDGLPVTGSTMTNGSLTGEITLVQGMVTVIEITITAEDEAATKSYTLFVKLLNVHEFYWGIYSPPMNRGYDEKWSAEKPPAPLFGGSNQNTINSEIPGGSLHWIITKGEYYDEEFDVTRDFESVMTFTSYNDGKYSVDYNDEGFVINDKMTALISLIGQEGYQRGTVRVMTVWGDLAATVDLHLRVEDQEKQVASDSYSDVYYLDSGPVRIMYAGSGAPYPFDSSYVWEESWSP